MFYFVENGPELDKQHCFSYVMDLKPGSRLNVVIEKEKLLDRNFDLVVSEPIEFDSDLDMLAADVEDKMPPLVSCSDNSEDGGNESDSMELLYPEDSEEESGNSEMFAPGAHLEYIASEKKFMMGDLLEEQIARILENAQDYPGDDVFGANDSRRKKLRFRVHKASAEYITVEDLYLESIELLPMDLPMGCYFLCG
ncbi:hypothetical protein B0H13DRAFT_1853195 [Mycena leptocephala]|nr:hypothetical protein B0H13DRAFT_1853195 [Mycena leptocephala]